jgi:hypothetical protein
LKLSAGAASGGGVLNMFSKGTEDSFLSDLTDSNGLDLAFD